MSGSTSGMKQSTTETQSVKGGEKQQSTTCGCESTGKCSCPPNQCTCPNCPREDAAKRGVDKQSATKPGEVSGEATKLPSVESAGIDIGKPLTLGGALNLSSITQFPSESDRAALDSSLSGPLNSLLEIRDCLVKHLNEGSFNEENIKACADQLDHWEGKYRSKEGVFAASGADFSSKTNQIPKGQEIIQQILHQIRDLQSVIKQRFEVGCVKGVGFSAMSGQQRQGGGEVGAEMGGTGTKKAAQVTELGTERY